MLTSTGNAPAYLEEDVSKPPQEHNGPDEVEAVVLEGLAHPYTAGCQQPTAGHAQVVPATSSSQYAANLSAIT
jgi:hypothetical protein